MKGYEYVHYMTLKEWKQWAENVSLYRKKELLKGEHNCFWQFIGRSFSWKASEQRHNYWCKIANRTQPLTNSTKKVKIPRK